MAQGITFLPLAVDTLGGWHTAALDTNNRLGRQVARNVGREEKPKKGNNMGKSLNIL